MKIATRPGNVHEVVSAPYTVTIGQGMLIGQIFGFADGAIASGGIGVLELVGIYTTTQLLASEAWTEGVKLYWDDTNKRLTTTVGSNKWVGCATKPKASNATSGELRLNGFAQ